MGHYCYACIVCGYLIRSFRLSGSDGWLQEYRAIYCDPTGPSITGVGCYTESESWIAPSDPTLRWDTKHEQNTQTELPVMRQLPSAGRHGFVLHEACWCLLREASKPVKISFRQLLNICESLPFPLRFNGVCWGHDYGKLLEIDTEKYYPWEEQFLQLRERTTCSSDATENPYEIPWPPTALSHSVGPPVDKTPKTATQDCFCRLPWEIREIIAILLPTNDALKLRLASRSFLPLYFSAIFWASRFYANGERGFLFEMRDKREAAELLSWYRCTRPAFCTPALRNRRRVWNLAKQLTDIISQRDADNGACTKNQTRAVGNWLKVTGDEQFGELNDERRLFYKGCRSIGTVVIHVSKRLVEIGITVAKFGAQTYITGIRFTPEGNPEIRAGHTSKLGEVIHVLAGLHGFRVAVGQGGIRALQVVGREHCSSWIGCATGVPVSERLISSESIEAIKVMFDGFKVTGLALSVQKAPLTRIPKPHMTIRQAALWYPTVPPEELCLNEASFTGQNPLCTEYRPLIWIRFGGQRGSCLSHVVGLSVQYYWHLHSVEFIYEGLHSEGPPSKLGRCDPKELLPSPTFAINGAAGERVESIEVGIEQHQHPRAYDFLKHGLLKAIKMTTNRGRVFEIGTACDGVRMQPLHIAKGTAITGLYASHDMEYGLISLGVISEML